MQQSKENHIPVAQMKDVPSQTLVSKSLDLKSSYFGDWIVPGTYKVTHQTVTLFRATDAAGKYNAYVTFSGYATSLGGNTFYAIHAQTMGVALYANFMNGPQGGVLNQWVIPVFNIVCRDIDKAIYFSQVVDPDIYDLVTHCKFGSIRATASVDCKDIVG